MISIKRIAAAVLSAAMISSCIALSGCSGNDTDSGVNSSGSTSGEVITAHGAIPSLLKR